MKITKQHVEQSIKDIDMIVEELARQEGLYDYRSKDLVEYWGNTRRHIAQCSARVLTGTAAKEKKAGRTVRDYSGEMETPKSEKKNVTNAIQLGKSNKFIIKKKNREVKAGNVPGHKLYVEVK